MIKKLNKTRCLLRLLGVFEFDMRLKAAANSGLNSSES